MPGYTLSNINFEKTQNCDIGSSYSGWPFFEHPKKNENRGSSRSASAKRQNWGEDPLRTTLFYNTLRKWKVGPRMDVRGPT